MRTIHMLAIGLVAAMGNSALGGAGADDSAAARLQEALRCERRGDLDGRFANLHAALDLDPEYAPARWQLGEIQHDGAWLRLDFMAALAERADDAAYLQRRQQTPATADAHLKLARWCRAQNWSAEERAHLMVAEYLAPADSRPKKLLGLKQNGGKWMTEREIEEAPQRQSEAKRIYQATKDRLLELGQILKDDDVNRREAAMREILAIRDARAIPAMEELMAGSHEALAEVVSQSLCRMPDRAATWALVRQALQSPYEIVRNTTIDELCARDPHFFVPGLIELLTPCEWSPEQWMRLSKGTSASIRMAQNLDATQVLVMQYHHGRTASGINGQLTRAISQKQYERISGTAQRRIGRVAQLLALITGVDFGIEQKAWRQWWSEYSHTYESPTYKPYAKPTNYLVSSAIAVSIPFRRTSCFVAGTLVWTRRGPVAIEQLELGDLVLAMHPETGELDYRPIVRRTVRPRTQITNLRINGETIGATLGHPFWVTGQGWVRAKDLKAGDLLRGCGDFAGVEAITEGPEEIAFNLEVAEFSTYFVGKSKILVHDNSAIEHEYRSVPGLVAAE